MSSADGRPTMTSDTGWEVDHLVVGAADLAQGAAWCRATFGVEPAAGGAHPFMGTHNRLLSIASAAYPRSYLEIIAIDPRAPPPGRVRWFDLDAAAVQAALQHGPALLHWVARCNDVEAARRALAGAGVDRGEILAAERASPQGLLRWRISVREDGQRLARGALPTLIEWAGPHPAERLPASGVGLQQLTLRGLPDGVQSMLPAGVAADPNPATVALSACFETPRGRIELASRV